MAREKSSVIVVLYFLYRIVLDIVYVVWQSPIYNYMGYITEINVVKFFMSYVILIIFVSLIPKTEKKISYLVLQLHLIIMIIPLTSIYALANFSTEFMLMASIAFILQVLLIKKLPNIKLVKIKGMKHAVILMTTFLTISTYGYLFLMENIHINVISFKDIYEIRAEQNIHFPISYFLVWQYRIINPILFIVFYLKGKKTCMVLTGIAQVLIYLMHPHKEVFFAIGYLIMLLFIYKRKILVAKFFTVMLAAGSVLSAIFYEISSLLMPYAILPSRLLYGPAKIKFQHYEFFSQTDKLFYSEGLLGKILSLKYPYDVSSGYVIGLHNGFNSNSNTGYLAYAYDNAGFIGMIIMSLLFATVLKLIDSQTKKYEPKLIFALIAYPMLILNDGDLLTLILTGGFFLIILLFFSIDEFIGYRIEN